MNLLNQVQYKVLFANVFREHTWKKFLLKMKPIFRIYCYFQQFFNQGTLFPLKWDSNLQQWQLLYQKNQTYLRNTYMTIASPLKLAALSLAAAIILIARHIPDLFDNYDIVAEGMFIFALLILFQLDYFIISHTDVLVLSSNWTHYIEKYHKISDKDQANICLALVLPIVTLTLFFYSCPILYPFFGQRSIILHRKRLRLYVSFSQIPLCLLSYHYIQNYFLHDRTYFCSLCISWRI